MCGVMFAESAAGETSPLRSPTPAGGVLSAIAWFRQLGDRLQEIIPLSFPMSLKG
jgi:hypothetical protein